MDFSLRAADGQELPCCYWEAEEDCRGTVVLVHGMAEHARRYGAFAGALAAGGFAVAALDLRGHGRTAGTQGSFGPGGWPRVLEDVHALCRWAVERNPGLPVALFGHSMGSLFARAAMESFGGELAAVVLCGPTVDLPVRRLAAPAIARLLGALMGRERPNAVLRAMTFGAFNKPFAPARTDFDWLSRETAAVDSYVADPGCGFTCSAGLYEEVSRLILFTLKRANIDRIPKRLSVLLVSGAEDPVGNCGDAAKFLLRQYRRRGMENVRLILYPGARHALLDETNRDAVVRDILDFYQEAL